MERTVADRELTPTEARGARFACATEIDEGAIRRLLRENPMAGAVSLTFEREPHYFRGTNVAGAQDQTIVAWSGDRLACMGRCSRRPCWVDGREVRAGYLAELRLDSAARGQFAFVRDGYRFFHDLQEDDETELYFTSIGSENERARRLLERGVRGMPIYTFLAELVTLLIAVPRSARRSTFHIETGTIDRIPEMIKLLNDQGRGHQLAAIWTAKRLLDLDQHGLPLNRFRLIMDGGRLLACGALWDQRGFRQTVIRGYSPSLAAMRPIVNFASQLINAPRMPSPGRPLAHAFLCPLAITPDADKSLPLVIDAFLPLARELELEYVTIALPATDCRLPLILRRFPNRKWYSRLYRVDWPGRPRFAIASSHISFLPDIALL